MLHYKNQALINQMPLCDATVCRSHYVNGLW